MSKRAKKRFILLIALVGLVTGGFFAARSIRQRAVEKQIAESREQGLNLFENELYEQALKKLSYYVSKRKDDGEVLLVFAECRLKVPAPNDKHIREGAGLLREAAAKLPDNPEPLLRLIELYVQLGFLTERLDICDRLLEMDPGNETALIAKIATLAALGGRLNDAIESSDLLIETYPDKASAHKWRLILWARRGDEDSALVDYSKLQADAHSDNPEFQLLYAESLARAGSVEEAQDVVRAISEMTSDNASEWLANLVDLFDRLGLADEADAMLINRLATADTNDETTTVMIERAWKRGEYDQARGYLPADDSDLDSLNDVHLAWVAFFAQSADTLAENHPAFLLLQQRSSEDARSWVSILQAKDSIIRGEWIIARNGLTEVVKTNTNQSVALFLLGQVNMRLGELDHAIAMFEAASNLDPVWPIAHQTLAQAYLDAGRLNEARSSAEQALAAKPAASQLVTVANVYIQLLENGRGDPLLENAVISVLRQLLDRLPDDPSLLAITARAYLASGQYDTAMPMIRRLIDESLAPETSFLLDLIDTCRLLGIAEEGPLLALGGQDNQNNTRILLRLAERSGQQGRVDEGKSLLKDAIQTTVNTAEKLEREIALATYLDHFDDPEALSAFQDVIARHPESAIAIRSMLDSKAAWNSEEVLDPAITRLQELTGDGSSSWRIYKSRLLLTFDSTTSNASQVIQLLSPVVRQNPADTRAQALVAEARLIQGNRDDAIEVLSIAVDANLTQVSMYPRLIKLLKQDGRSAEAEQRLLEFSNRPIPPSQILVIRERAVLLAENGLWDQAIREIKPFAETGSTIDETMLAEFYRRSGQLDKALAAYEKAVSNSEVTDGVIVSAASFFARSGQFQKGLDLLEGLPESPNSLIKQLTIAAYIERAGQFDKAEDYLAELIKQKNTAEAWSGMVRFLVRRGADRLPDAAMVIEDGLNALPNDPSLLSMRNYIAALEGGDLTDDVIDQMNLAAKGSVEDLAFQKLLAAEQFRRANPNDKAGFLAKLNEAVDKHPSVFGGWFLLITEYTNQNMGSEAVSAAIKASQALPASAEAAELTAETLIRYRQYEQALSYAQRWRDASLDQPFKPEMTIAFVEWRLGRDAAALQRAEQWKSQILQTRDVSPHFLELLASLLAKSGRHDEAHELLWDVATSEPAWARAYVNIAENIPDIDAARQWLVQSESFTNTTTETHAVLVMEYYKLAYRDESNEAFQKIIDIASTRYEEENFPASMVFMIGAAYQQLEQFGEAERMFRYGLQRSPDDAIGMINLAFLLHKQNDVGGDAEELARKAIEIGERFRFASSVQANFFDTLGLILNDKQNHDDAMKTFNRAYGLDPQNASIRLGIIETNLALGQLESATTELRQLTTLLQGGVELDKSDQNRYDKLVSLVGGG